MIQRIVIPFVLCILIPSLDLQAQPTSRPATARPGPKSQEAPLSKSQGTPLSRSQAAPLKTYEQTIPGTPVKYTMIAIPGGSFSMGSPESEAGRAADEGPQHTVKVAPFWMGRCEVTWDEYEQYTLSLEKKRRQGKPTERDLKADAITRPTPAYMDMTFGMGKLGYPAICMTQHAAKQYCKWLSAKTGHYYRLPTEAEWEYACRAGSKSAYSFGNDVKKLGDYAWFDGNTKGAYQKVGRKKPNAWGLHDMHGNVCEWCLDAYSEAGYPGKKPRTNPLVRPKSLYPRIVRGGSYCDEAPLLRSAARVGSDEMWKMQDPQLPQSIWYHTDALFVGFRVIRPLHEPSDAEKKAFE